MNYNQSNMNQIHILTLFSPVLKYQSFSVKSTNPCFLMNHPSMPWMMNPSTTCTNNPAFTSWFFLTF